MKNLPLIHLNTPTAPSVRAGFHDQHSGNPESASGEWNRAGCHHVGRPVSSCDVFTAHRHAVLDVHQDRQSPQGLSPEGLGRLFLLSGFQFFTRFAAVFAEKGYYSIIVV